MLLICVCVCVCVMLSEEFIRYSDVSNEVSPVESGYRWVLTYNLATIPSPEKPRRAPTKTGNRYLRDLLKSWAKSRGTLGNIFGWTCLFFMYQGKFTYKLVWMLSIHIWSIDTLEPEGGGINHIYVDLEGNRRRQSIFT